MIDKIVKKTKSIIRQCETRDPFRIAHELGIDVEHKDLGHLKGMYSVIKRNRFIVINSAMSEYMQKLVCAHEIGHDQFHRDLAANGWLYEFMIYNMNTRSEYEANIFASELLLPDNDILELIDKNFDYEQIAETMYSDINLVGIKIGTLVRKGYDLRQFEFRDNFLK